MNDSKEIGDNQPLNDESSSQASNNEEKHQYIQTLDLNEHENIENSFKCSVTQKLFGDSSAEIDLIIKDYLNASNQRVNPDVSKGIFNQNNKCPQCDYATACMRNLRRHLDEVHEKKKPYKCEKCDYTASRTSDLRRHVDAVHEGKKPYKCQKCDYVAAQTTHLRQHINAVHEGKKPNKCQKCDYATSRKSDLRKHIDAVHEKKKPYECSKCDYKASRISHLREHVDAMHGEKPQLNSHSGCRTIQASHLEKHIKEVHEKLKYFKCTKCEFKTSWSSHLQRHVNAVHKKKKETPKCATIKSDVMAD